MQSVNPATGEIIKVYDDLPTEKIAGALGEVHQAFLEWKETTFEDRAALFFQIAEVLESRRDGYAELMAREMGKPVAEGRGEIHKCAWACRFYAEHAQGFLADEVVETDAGKSYSSCRPLGPILAVMPWNFPFWQVFRFAAPNLMAGNVGVLKHAENVPGCALAIEAAFREAGFPQNVFRTLLVPVERVGAIIENQAIRAVTLTGSPRAGRAVARQAGAALKKTVLELGGSDPYLILEDADLETAAGICVTSRLMNSGQSCIAAKRFVVVDSCRAEFEGLVVEKMSAAKMGDPLDEETQIGPLARIDLRDNLHRQVDESLREGAKCLLGGRIPEGPGAFYPPTVLGDVHRHMPAFQEELFGPVASIIAVGDEDEAVEVANDSVYGLGAAVFTSDPARGERLAADRLEAGCCFVNAFVRSDPRLPFGGLKESGYGRELGRAGIREFVNIKTVYVDSP